MVIACRNSAAGAPSPAEGMAAPHRSPRARAADGRRRRQVSWLAGQTPPARPSRAGTPAQWPAPRTTGRMGRRLAADSCWGSRRLAGLAAPRTAFPFHPLARDQREIRICLYLAKGKRPAASARAPRPKRIAPGRTRWGARGCPHDRKAGARRPGAAGRGTLYRRRASTKAPSSRSAAISASEKPCRASTASVCSAKRGGGARVPPGVRDSLIGVPRPR